MEMLFSFVSIYFNYDDMTILYISLMFNSVYLFKFNHFSTEIMQSLNTRLNV